MPTFNTNEIIIEIIQPILNSCTPYLTGDNLSKKVGIRKAIDYYCLKQFSTEYLGGFKGNYN